LDAPSSPAVTHRRVEPTSRISSSSAPICDGPELLTPRAEARRFNRLRDPQSAAAAGSDNLTSMSACSSPNRAFDDRTVSTENTPVSAANNSAVLRVITQSQFTSFVEQVNTVLAGIHQQWETEDGRIAHLERKLQSNSSEQTGEINGTERFAEMEGSVSGLLEEMQALTRRVEAIDDHVWSQNNVAEKAMQQNREVVQQVHSLEQRCRQQVGGVEEAQRRQAAKIRRMEHTVEEVERRLMKLEEELAHGRHGDSRWGSSVQSQMQQLEEKHEQVTGELRSLHELIHEGLQGIQDERSCDNIPDPGADISKLFRNELNVMDEKMSGQIEDLKSTLAALRVKVDSQLQRVGMMSDRIDKAYKPAIESLREEISQARHLDRQEMDGEVEALRSRLQEFREDAEEAISDLRAALRHVRTARSDDGRMSKGSLGLSEAWPLSSPVSGPPAPGSPERETFATEALAGQVGKLRDMLEGLQITSAMPSTTAVQYSQDSVTSSQADNHVAQLTKSTALDSDKFQRGSCSSPQHDDNEVLLDEDSAPKGSHSTRPEQAIPLLDLGAVTEHLEAIDGLITNLKTRFTGGHGAGIVRSKAIPHPMSCSSVAQESMLHTMGQKPHVSLCSNASSCSLLSMGGPHHREKCMYAARDGASPHTGQESRRFNFSDEGFDSTSLPGTMHMCSHDEAHVPLTKRREPCTPDDGAGHPPNLRAPGGLARRVRSLLQVDEEQVQRRKK